MWNVNNVRQTFIDYFCNLDHTFCKSSSVKPKNDPSLLFCNAGMNQWKPIFLGKENIKYKRICNSQKCVRAGGKHNDLDDVGKDIYHHTFFEMLGSWSFDDYWKNEAIEYAWDLLVNVYKIDQRRLYVTYFEGNEELGIPEDIETKNIWNKYLPEERIIKCGMKDNFWEMGECGPCGPSTEIHYDLSPMEVEGQAFRDASSLVNMDDPTVLEIWNIVFILYNREDDSTLKILKNRFVDTGMGLERLVAVLQNKKSNYDTDVFETLFNEITEVTKGKIKYQGKVGLEDENEYDTTCRIIVDHIRTACICLSDDIIPGHNSRENVLRHIIRRAIRYSKMNLHISEPFFWKLTDIVADTLGEYYLDIKNNKEKIKYIIENEERIYIKTLVSAYRVFDNLLKKKAKSENNVISTKEVSDLCDTYGYPRETIKRDILEKGFTF